MTQDRRMLLVTGGARGIGRATCLAAARRGYDVCFCYRKDEAAASALVTELAQLGAAAHAVKADIAEPEDVEALFRVVDERAGRLDGLVNNAGITGRAGPFMDADPGTIETVFAVNVFGLMACCRAAVARMARSAGGAGGAIVNLSSGAATTGSSGAYVWYAASKAAVETFTLGFAREVAEDGVRVNAVSPGITATDIHDDSGRAESHDALARSIPLGRLATPDDIADPILYLLSDAASYVTGAVLRVGGGR